MNSRSRCERLLTEQWTPGRHGSPDGPSRTVRFRCVLAPKHKAPHVFIREKPYLGEDE